MKEVTDMFLDSFDQKNVPSNRSFLQMLLNLTQKCVVGNAGFSVKTAPQNML